MQKNKWIADLEDYVDAIPYGHVQIRVERVGRRTTEVTTEGSETLRYTDNEECLRDLAAFLRGLIGDNHTGDVQFGVEMKHGQLTLLTIKNTRKTGYQT